MSCGTKSAGAMIGKRGRGGATNGAKMSAGATRGERSRADATSGETSRGAVMNGELHGAFRQVVDEQLGCFERDRFLRLRRRCPQVRRHDHVRQLQERMIGRRRLLYENIERRSCEMP